MLVDIIFPPSSKRSEITQSTSVCLFRFHLLTLTFYFFFLLWLTAEDTCGGTLRGSSGLISSFDFPGSDSAGTRVGGGAGGLGSSGECKWTILADPGDTISLVFTEFQMEEKSDYLEVEGSEPPTIWWVDLWEQVLVEEQMSVWTMCYLWHNGVHWQMRMVSVVQTSADDMQITDCLPGICEKSLVHFFKRHFYYRFVSLWLYIHRVKCTITNWIWCFIKKFAFKKKEILWDIEKRDKL